MDKVLVEIFVPAIGETYSVFIPLQVQMFVVVESIKKAVSELSDQKMIVSDSTTICRREDGAILNINLSVNELGIHNGSKLMLI